MEQIKQIKLPNGSTYEVIDATVPQWAKQSTKPTYTASEVGALPNTTSIPDALSDLTSDSTHRTVTDTEKATWNAKSNFSGSYNDLTNKPTIPTIPASLPANGGNADTVDNKHASDFAAASHEHTTHSQRSMSNTDLNTIKTAGWYYGYTGMTNAPEQTIAVMEVLVYSPDWIVQRFIVVGGCTEYIRTWHSATTWSAWKTNVDSGNIGSQSVASATKATQDGNGNNIANTYATKAEVSSGGSVAANKITAGTFATTDIKAANGTDYGTARIRNIYAGTTDMTAGSSTLANGCIYLVYE